MPDENFGMWRDIAAGQQRQRTEERLESIEKELRAQRSKVVANCPYCDGDLSKIGVELCKHCGSKLFWSGHFVSKASEPEVATNLYRNWQHAKEEQANQRQELIKQRREEIEQKEIRLKTLTEEQKHLGPLTLAFWGSITLSFLLFALKQKTGLTGALGLVVAITACVLMVIVAPALGWFLAGDGANEIRVLKADLRRLKQEKF